MGGFGIARSLVEFDQQRDGMMEQDYPKHYCGVFGIYGHPNAAELTYYGLYALQHRGQESAGIATSEGDRIHLKAKMGLVSQVFREETLTGLPGHVGIGHTRYSTMGGSKEYNAQPLLADGQRGQIAVGHNGNVINAADLRIEMAEEFGSTFEKTSDTEVIAELFATAPGSDCVDDESINRFTTLESIPISKSILPPFLFHPRSIIVLNKQIF